MYGTYLEELVVSVVLDILLEVHLRFVAPPAPAQTPLLPGHRLPPDGGLGRGGEGGGGDGQPVTRAANEPLQSFHSAKKTTLLVLV